MPKVHFGRAKDILEYVTYKVMQKIRGVPTLCLCLKSEVGRDGHGSKHFTRKVSNPQCT